MSSALEPAVSAALIAWGEEVVLGAEIPHANRASRTWFGRVCERDVVVKLTFDGPLYVEPGFRIAAYIQDATGVLTGYPLLTSDGQYTVPFAGGGEWPWTLAVMDFVGGTPLDDFDDNTAAMAGELLGLVHSATSRATVPKVPANTLDFFSAYPPFRADRGVQTALAEVAALERERELTYGVVYGDPRPELLYRGEGEPLALIDWGTPSRGPLMLDVATWHGHIDRYAMCRSASRSFVTAYASTGVVRAPELASLGTFRKFWEALSSPAN